MGVYLGYANLVGNPHNMDSNLTCILGVMFTCPFCDTSSFDWKSCRDTHVYLFNDLLAIPRDCLSLFIQFSSAGPSPFLSTHSSHVFTLFTLAYYPISSDAVRTRLDKKPTRMETYTRYQYALGLYVSFTNWLDKKSPLICALYGSSCGNLWSLLCRKRFALYWNFECSWRHYSRLDVRNYPHRYGHPHLQD